MILPVDLPAEVADRLNAESVRRGVTPEVLAAELIGRELPLEAQTNGTRSALDAFIGSGRSGRNDLGRRHRELLREATEGLTARDQ